MSLRKFVTLLALSFVLNQLALTTDSSDGSVVERISYSFPTYEKASQASNMRGYATKEEYERAIQDSGFEFQKLKYLSDGLKVTAYLYKPARLDGKKFPAVIF